MRKILLTCLLGLGIGANAQYSYLADFESNYSNTVYAQFGGGSRTAAAACNGEFGGQLALSTSTTQTGFMVNLSQIEQTNNGQKVDVTASIKKNSGLVGTATLAYFIYNSATNQWSIQAFGTPMSLATGEITTCTTLSATIPSGTLNPANVYGIGVWVVRTSGSGNVYVDDINIAQEVVNVPPSCTSLLNPVNGSTINAGNVPFSWNPAEYAVNYRLSLGTTSGATDIFNSVLGGNQANVSLPTNTLVYAKLTPMNSVGEASGCGEISFTTNNTIGYCGPITSTAPTEIYPISSVTIGGKSNTSTATAGSLPPHEDFTAIEMDVLRGVSTPISVIGTGLGTNRFGMSVFIDWNGDGDFNDANESYFTTPTTMKGGTGATITMNGDIQVPADAILGKTRMRVKYNFSSSTTSVPAVLSDACSNLSYGQVEDYTIVVKEVTEAPSCVTISSPVNEATGVPANSIINWSLDPLAAGYKVYAGTTAGGTDILNGTEVTSNSLDTLFPINTTVYLKVVPFNAIGDAEGCEEISFTTGELVYCAAAATSTSYEKISNVKFAEIDNPSESIGGYEDFTSLIATVNRGAVDLPIEVSISEYDAPDKVTVWIDFNQNGKLGDEQNEIFILTSAEVSTGLISIPTDAKIGQTRMRVRLNYSTDPAVCGNQSFGQVEDYTVNVVSVPDCVEITSPVNGATDVALDASLEWEASENTTGYKVYIGTATGNYDVVNGEAVTTTSYLPTLAAETQYFVKVVPFNELGDATDCAEMSFTTIADAVEGCSQGIPSQSTLPNALNISTTSQQRIADDFIVGAEGFLMNKITIDVNQVGLPTVIKFNIRKDNNDEPGEVVQTLNFTSADASEVVGAAYGDPIYHLTFNLVTPVGLTEGKYWLEPIMTTPGETSWLAVADYQSTQNSSVFVSADSGTTWAADVRYSMIFTVSGECSYLGTVEYGNTKVSFYPNPVIDNLNITADSKVVTVEVFAVDGKVVFAEKANAKSTKVNLSRLAAGYYVVKATLESGEMKTFKVIKK